jgi:hypothetical protein
MLTKSCEKVTHTFYCLCCDYNTSRKSSYDKHLLTQKHHSLTSVNKALTNSCEKCTERTNYRCHLCDKQYKSRVGLWKHSKTCNFEDKTEKNEISDKELIVMIMKQNAELMKENSEMKNMMMDVIKTGTHNTTNNTINNHNNFNLNFFLNETCKNALNIDDFVSSVKVSLSELENTGRRGYVEGISSIILNKLNTLSHRDRPIHCSDYKRETMYIKNDNQWIKETEEKPILKKAIKTIANENIKQINAWRQQYPDCTDSDSKKNNLYLKIVSNSMCGSTKEETEKNYEKIVSNLAKQVIIDK